jgi:hypothetical protein
VPLLGPEIGASLELGQYFAHALRFSVQLTSECAKPFLLRGSLGLVIERMLLRGSCR